METKMDELAKRFAELADKYGPHVTEAALGAVRVEAYSVLVSGFLAGIAAVICGRACYKALRIAQAKKEGYELFAIICFFTGCVCVLLTVAAVWKIVDPWVWAALFHPDLWLAKKVFHL